jgi:hypothetical protein
MKNCKQRSLRWEISVERILFTLRFKDMIVVIRKPMNNLKIMMEIVGLM